MKRALGMEHLTLKGHRVRATRGGALLLGNLEDLLKKALGTGISIGAPLQLRKTWNLVGSYTRDV